MHNMARFGLMLILLLLGGCVGSTLRDDPQETVIPAGTGAIVSRCFDPVLLPFLEDVRLGSFIDTGCDCAGYYTPIIGVRIDHDEIGRSEFEGTMVHELLHAVHFNGFVDEDRFEAACERLLADPHQVAFVADVRHLPWNNWANVIFLQSEYFARIGEAIISRRGVGVPDYVLAAYAGILHPRLWVNAQQYACHPFPATVSVECGDGTVLPDVDLLAYALGLRSKRATVWPRRDVRSIITRLFIPFDGSQTQPVLLQFRRRSTGKVLVQTLATPLVNGTTRLLSCTWDPAQARLIMQAWLDLDLSIEVVESLIAQHR